MPRVFSPGTMLECVVPKHNIKTFSKALFCLGVCVCVCVCEKKCVERNRANSTTYKAGSAVSLVS